jgi:UDP-N-acetyl-D-mannosaminuronate dehydrogenase
LILKLEKKFGAEINMAGIDLSDRSKVLAIIGQGYVGLPLAMAAVDAGWSVIGIEKSASRVAQLNSGSSPVEDISDARLAKAIAANKFLLLMTRQMFQQLQ